MGNARFKKHRWTLRVLKSSDPLIFSIGWRRFQSLPVYATDDGNEKRCRYLKYTPEHMHCHASFYGPFVPPNTGILAIKSLSRRTQGFRVSGTGVVLELNASLDIVKKLKLTGSPQKILKNTAYISGMFNSDIEVAKFEGAKIKTVSGIRGSIKKAVGAGSEKGTFRATFEDKILPSDIVFCRLWVPVEVKHYYNPVASMLTSERWEGMRTIAQIRKDTQTPIPVEKDSLYKPIERAERKFAPTRIPLQLQKELPFASKPK